MRADGLPLPVRPRHPATFAAFIRLTLPIGLFILCAMMTKEKLIEIINRILQTDADLSFLAKLDDRELETLVACIRGRVDRSAN